MQQQIALVQEAIERERKAQKQVMAHLVAPVDAIFDLLEQTSSMLRRQAEALEAAGRALEESAALVKGQAELFERTIGALRRPTELAKSAVGLEAGTPKRGTRQPPRSRTTKRGRTAKK